MAITKRVIILEQTGNAPLSYRYVMWADVPTARQAYYAAKQAEMESAYKDASQSDIDALRNGSVTERVDQTMMAAGDTLNTAMARLQAIWTAYQAEITGANPLARYGSYMDTNNSWTAGGAS